MEAVRPIGKREDILDYSRELAGFLFKGVTRDNGLDYTQAHLKALEELVDWLTTNSDYKKPVLALAWVHDVVEDIPGFDVFDPFKIDNMFQRQPGITYMNDLFTNAGYDAKALSFMLNLVTQRPETNYSGYIGNIIDFQPRSPRRDLHILASIVKFSDTHLNTNPEEKANVETLLKTYAKIDEIDEHALRQFYVRTKTYHAFNLKPDLRHDYSLFADTVKQRFHDKQIARATDNLLTYLPLMEKKILVESGDSDLFHWERLRKKMRETYENSLQLYGKVGSLDIVERAGQNRGAPRGNGYKTILQEMREEINRDRRFYYANNGHGAASPAIS